MAKRTLLDLAASLERRAKTVDELPSKSAVRIAEYIIHDLAYSTPVDTSEALSNWTVGIDARPRSELGPHFPGKFGSTQGASAQETIADAKAELGKKKPGQTIYISNNSKHIRFLNDGSSSQAPAGFVERAVLIARKLAQAK